MIFEIRNSKILFIMQIKSYVSHIHMCACDIYTFLHLYTYIYTIIYVLCMHSAKFKFAHYSLCLIYKMITQSENSLP